MTEDDKSAVRALVECVKMAKEKHAICYVYKRDGKGFWGLSYEYWDNWLFKAYPGGRKQVSRQGMEYFKEVAPGLAEMLERVP